jgi:DNA helicase-2/ATP-dependent DNA helicase PcrA
LQSRYLAAKRRLFDKYYEMRLNSRQREAVCSVDGPLLVLAGAGSGKTTVLVQRIAFIIKYGNAYYNDATPESLSECEVAELENACEYADKEQLEAILPRFIYAPCPPWAVLAITFTNKAANEIKERLHSSFEDESIPDSIWSGTFHSVCVRILRKYTEQAGYKSNFSIYDTDEKKRLVSECMKKLNIDEKMLPVRSVMNAISMAKDKLISPEEYECGKDIREKHIKDIYKEYQSRIEAQNALDFDDIIMKTVSLLENCDEAREYYASKFRYVCVDEYQDTNVAQFRLTELLSGKYRNIMVVGDDDQSIYKFRGATVENILGFDQAYPDAKVIKLEQNYRSTKNILDAANAVISHNTSRHGKQLWCAGGEGELLSIKELPTQNEESRYIIDRILELVVREKMRYRDMAVLYRVNELSRSLESAFAKSGIPYRVIGGQRFYDRKEIRDMCAYLYVIFNPNDNQRLKRIINEPKRKIGASTVEAIEEIAESAGVSMYEIMRTSTSIDALSKSSARLVEFTDMMDKIRQTHKKPSEILGALFEETGYHAMLKAEGEISAARIDSVNEFITAAIEYESRTEEASLGGFLEDVALVSDVDKYDENADAVVLMTIHSAKGLEFPVVFLSGMEDGIFPSAQNLYSEVELAEERRLAYVAITRAKTRLFATHVHERMLYGRTMYNKLSLFLREEIPEHLKKVEQNERAMRADRGFVTPKKPKAQISDEFFKRADSSHNTVVPRASQKPAAPNSASFGVKRFSEGARVVHSLFGLGTIVSVRDMGGDILYEVAFDSGATKKLMATFAKLSSAE